MFVSGVGASPCRNDVPSRQPFARGAYPRSRHDGLRLRRLVLDGREHGGTLISAGVTVLSEVDASCLCPGWVPHRAATTCQAVSRLPEGPTRGPGTTVFGSAGSSLTVASTAAR